MLADSNQLAKHIFLIMCFLQRNKSVYSLCVFKSVICRPTFTVVFVCLTVKHACS